MTMQARCGLNGVDYVLVDRYFHGLRIYTQHILALKILKMLMGSSNMPSRQRTLPIIKPENLVHLNGLHKRPHDCAKVKPSGTLEFFFLPARISE